MITDFSFFEQSLAETRTYNVKTAWHCDRFVRDKCFRYHTNKFDVRPYIEILSMSEDDYEEEEENEDEDVVLCCVRGSHVMKAGNPTGVEAINQRFNITLPQGVDDFYRRWDGGFLLFQEFYEIFSVQEIIKEAEFLNQLEDPPAHALGHFIRFCDLGNGVYLALRRIQENQWDVVFNQFGAENINTLLDPSQVPAEDAGFSIWLKRMCNTDGWPIGAGITGMGTEDDGPPAERIG